MARIFKQQYTVKEQDGGKRTQKSRKWYVEFRDGQGIRRRVPGYTDKQATQQLASELERKAAREQAGLVDRFEEHRKRPLEQHVDDWAAALVGKGSGARQVRLVTSRARTAISKCKFRVWNGHLGGRRVAFPGEPPRRGHEISDSQPLP